MEHVTSCNVTDGSTSGKVFPMQFEPITTSCNIRGIMGSCVLCGSAQRLYLKIRNTPVSLEKSRETSDDGVRRVGGWC
jgi:hypothetical protein